MQRNVFLSIKSLLHIPVSSLYLFSISQSVNDGPLTADQTILEVRRRIYCTIVYLSTCFCNSLYVFVLCQYLIHSTACNGMSFLYILNAFLLYF